MKIDFSKKTVIVTGASRGIGRDIVENFLKLGAKVLATGTDKERIRHLNSYFKGKGSLKYLHLDFLSEESVNKFLSEIRKYRIDVCVNNAGINRINLLTDTTTQDWDDLVKVNLRGPFILTREVAKIMKKNNYGRIINISSIFGVVTKEKRTAYASTKSGLIGLTKTAAVELAPYNILVNSVSPGFVLTDLTKGILTKSEILKLKSMIPMGRLGKPEDISRVVIFLASGLNTYLTGQNIIVDGGYVSL